MTSSEKPQSAHEESPAEKPSFMKSLLLGDIEEALVIPYPEFPAKQKETVDLVIDTFRRFAAENIDAVRFDREAHYPREVIAGLGEIGMTGLLVPEEYGGLGLSQSGYSRVMEVVAAIDAATAVTVGAHSSIGMKAILN
jgi:alkylation response protein AidB-like acyl-CoA dehydrogenase